LKRVLANNQIRAEKVRLIDEEGKQMGIFSLEEALKIAQERNLDLIQVTEKLEIPVCRLANLGKYLYQMQKKEGKKGKKEGELKTIRLSFNISPHDLETKVDQAEKLIKKGNKIRLELKFKGREGQFLDFGKEKINHFIKVLKERVPVKIERDIKKEPRGLTVIISK
jgi:translation initiation factor IF-3